MGVNGHRADLSPDLRRRLGAAMGAVPRRTFERGALNLEARLLEMTDALDEACDQIEDLVPIPHLSSA